MKLDPDGLSTLLNVAVFTGLFTDLFTRPEAKKFSRFLRCLGTRARSSSVALAFTFAIYSTVLYLESRSTKVDYWLLRLFRKLETFREELITGGFLLTFRLKSEFL